MKKQVAVFQFAVAYSQPQNVLTSYQNMASENDWLAAIE